MRKTSNTADIIAYHESEITAQLARWNYIKEHGASDPAWPDGINMNLVRNHIIHHLKEIERLRGQPRQLSIFDIMPGAVTHTDIQDKRIPPKVPNSFMATNRKLTVPYTGVD